MRDRKQCGESSGDNELDLLVGKAGGDVRPLVYGSKDECKLGEGRRLDRWQKRMGLALRTGEKHP